MCLKCESASRNIQPGEGPSRGLLRDCKNIVDVSFAGSRSSWISPPAASWPRRWPSPAAPSPSPSSSSGTPRTSAPRTPRCCAGSPGTGPRSCWTPRASTWTPPPSHTATTTGRPTRRQNSVILLHLSKYYYSINIFAIIVDGQNFLYDVY